MKVKHNDPKVIFVIHSFNISGVLTQSLILAKYLKAKGYEVIIIGKKGKYGNKLFKKYGIKTLLKDDKTLNKIQHLDLANVKLIMCESIFSYDAFIAISKLFPESSRVLRVHEEVNEELLERNLWQSTLGSEIEEIFGQFELTIFPSNHTANFYSEKIGRNKFSVIPITINEDIQNNAYRINGHVFRVLQLGTVYERKNPIFTLIAFEKFLSRYSPLKSELIFVGARNANKSEVDYLRRLRKEIRARKLSDKIKIVKTNLSPEKYISKASLVTLHSISECTPTVYLEANYLGKYVVASAVGGVNEIIENGVNGYLFNYGDTDEQANLFGKVYEQNLLNIPNQSLRDYYCNKFSNELFFHKIEGEFEKLL